MSGIRRDKASALAAVRPDDQGADEPRARRHGHGPQVPERDARPAQGFVDHRQHLPHVRSRGDLGNHATIALVQTDLRGHDAGANRRHAGWLAVADLREPPRPSRRTLSRWPEGAIPFDLQTSGQNRATTNQTGQAERRTIDPTRQCSAQAALAFGSASFALMTSSALSSCLSTKGPAVL